MNYESMTDRELDALVAERVTKLSGFRRSEFRGRLFLEYVVHAGPAHYANVPFYSRDIAAAFSVVDAMRERGRLVEIKSGHDKRWDVCIMDPDTQVDIWTDESLPRAICIAALRALDE